ncbi:MAG: glycine cleavage system protein H [Planctomycetota bacterium]|nr:MAG: glycine cleavage system protein H [Planctomycetota bacterium]REJ89769.1 MAG: glycine cleavage system protein H [Planctomycetota bacterium]REK21591.1 MAG: glycine cleavage system protein H [Planctomycetota bacterium]REK39856.1 MAG: glycine cleavage system protein H [Planctomycetota bacterium]
MSADLVFMMGNYEARIPRDRRYSDNHLWLQPHDGAYRVGFTAYSVRLLQDVYFLNWDIEPNTAVRKKQEIGQIESSKAVSSLYAPADGTIHEFNEHLYDDPSAVNTGGYSDGWLYRFSTSEEFLTAEQYVEKLESVWEETQRVVKGQLN